jgi:hypothetical protein
MTKMLIAVLSLSVLGYLAYRTLYGRAAAVDAEAPTERLQNVKEAAEDIEEKGRQRVEEIDQKTE